MSRRHSSSSNEGDWVCPDPKCGNVNFSRRHQCNRCGAEKSHVTIKAGGSAIGKQLAEKSKGLFSADDWQCKTCGNVNWARRSDCNLCKSPKFGKVEARTGYGGGYNERLGVEYKSDKEDSDGEFDDFGRKKKKFRGTLPPKPTAVEETKKEEEEDEEESGDDADLDAYNLDSDDDDNDDADLSKYDLGDDDDTDDHSMSASSKDAKRTQDISRGGSSSRSSGSSTSSSSRSSKSSRSRSSRSRSSSRSSYSRSRSRSRSRSLDRKYRRQDNDGSRRSPNPHKRRDRDSSSSSSGRKDDHKRRRHRSRSR